MISALAAVTTSTQDRADDRMQKNIMPSGSSFFCSILVGIQPGASFALGALPPPSAAAARAAARPPTRRSRGRCAKSAPEPLLRDGGRRLTP